MKTESNVIVKEKTSFSLPAWEQEAIKRRADTEDGL